MGLNPEQQAAQIQQVGEEARRLTARMQQAAEDPEQQQENIRQNNAIYAGLVAIGLVLVQPFLTAAALDIPAKICVLAFSAAIPLLVALLLVNRQETFRRQVSGSRLVRATQPVAQVLAFVGVVAGFWHIMWVAGAGILVFGFVAMLIHSAGYFSLERAAAETHSPQPGSGRGVVPAANTGDADA